MGRTLVPLWEVVVVIGSRYVLLSAIKGNSIAALRINALPKSFSLK